MATALALFFGGGTYAYCTPYTLMSLDVNPSFELSANIFDIVIDIKPMNEDAALVLQTLNLKNQSVGQAVAALVRELAQEGYFWQGEANGMMATAYSKDSKRAQAVLSQMLQTMTQEMARSRVNAPIEGACVSSELRIRAQGYGVTPGKLMLAERYLKTLANPMPGDLENCFGKSVGQLLGAIGAFEEQNRQQNQGEEQGPGQNQQQNGASPSPSGTGGNGAPGGQTGGQEYGK
jgi:hypothetical protein